MVKKRRTVESDGAGVAAAERVSESSNSEDIFNVEFEGRLLDQTDFHNIKAFLKQMLCKAPLDLGTAADDILAKAGRLGCCLVAMPAEEEDAEEDMETEGEVDDPIYSVVTLVDGSRPCATAVLEYLRQRTATTSPLPEASQLVWLINERMVNLPAEVAAPQFLLLAEQAAETKALSSATHIFAVLKSVREKGNPEKEELLNAEEEVLLRHASYIKAFSVGDEIDGGLAGDWASSSGGVIELEPFRTFVLVPVSSWPAVISEISTTFCQSG